MASHTIKFLDFSDRCDNDCNSTYQFSYIYIYICQQFSDFYEVNKIGFIYLFQKDKNKIMNGGTCEFDPVFKFKNYVGHKSSSHQSCYPITDRTIISESISSQNTCNTCNAICVQQSIAVISNTDNEAIDNSLGCKMTVSKHIATLEFESI